MKLATRVCVFFLLLTALAPVGASEQAPSKPTIDPSLWEGMSYRHLGPFRGGRSAAVCGVPGKPTTFVFGATGGGVWRTDDGGHHWRCLSDGFFGGSIGAVTVSEWDPNVIYAGGGEVTVRGNVSSGNGVYRSLDAGKTWKHMGLEQTHHIPRIRIHPRDPNLVYVAALGHIAGPNPERGIFRSKNGGESWEKIHFLNNEVGAVDLCMDPSNPRVLYASMWRVKRTPYSLESGGDGSSLWKSTDGGDTWTDLSQHKGLPKGMWGISGVAVSPLNSDRVWAIIEAEDGGLFRSDDGGTTWSRQNEERDLRQRAWYYTRVYADTQDVNTLYVVNVQLWRSTDGGSSFKSIPTPHGDHHDLWIAPEDASRLIVADDGGAQVSYDAGARWSTYENQPTAQIYRISTDTSFPYRILGSQQDNTTLRMRHRSENASLSEEDWDTTAGGESGYVVADPLDPEIVYGGSYGGYLTRYNHRTHEERSIQVWPDNPMGHGAEDLKYRFQWNFPIFFSPNDPKRLFCASNVLFETRDEGHSWRQISPDLTTNDKSKQGSSGGPITKDNTSVEYYCTIFAAAESAVEKGVIYTGSDDGLVYVTRDDGANWTQITPPDLPQGAQINAIEVHPSARGAMYFAATRYKLDDFTPYLYKTRNYGKTWQRITMGIDPKHFTRVLRADPKRSGLLYAGTEQGMYLSFNDGESWQPFQLNLPQVPITDLTVKDMDLIVATQGRSLWILDDLSPLHNLGTNGEPSKPRLFPPRASWRLRARAAKKPENAGENLAGGVLVQFFLPEDPLNADDKKTEATKDQDAAAPKTKEDKTTASELVLEFLDPQGTVIRTFSSAINEKDAKKTGKGRLDAKKGFNRFVWDMRTPDAISFDKMIVWSGSMRGPVIAPGVYQVRMTWNGEIQSQSFTIVADPRSSASQEDLTQQFDFLIQVRDKLSQTHRGIERIRTIREQVERMTTQLDKHSEFEDVIEAAKALKQKLDDVENALYQTKNRSEQDPLNYPIMLNDRLAGVKDTGDTGDARPTESALAVKAELFAAIDAELGKLAALEKIDVVAFNALVHQKQIPAIWLEAQTESSP